MLPKKIIFCLPGRQFSGEFLTCWTSMIHHCLNNGHTMYLSQKYTSNVYYVRSLCLGADVRRGKNQKPFDGQIDYDYIMWIDSDIIFNTIYFDKLISNDVDICGGVYLMDGGKQFAAVKNWDENRFQENGTFDFLTPDDISKSPNLMEVVYTGFGFLLIKKGVFEKIEYPWFNPKILKIGNCYDFASEDVSFCLKARELGFKIYIDPTVWVKHQKITLY
jgi:GT2 family glycosyltransferase